VPPDDWLGGCQVAASDAQPRSAARYGAQASAADQLSFVGWIGQGATSCWESWTGINGPDQGPLPQQRGGQATHNHILVFLCGGVGEWQYEFLAGIVPTSAGYSTVRVRPLISKTLGPASVTAEVTTVRGTVSSDWTRDVTLPAGAATRRQGRGSCGRRCMCSTRSREQKCT